MGDKEFDVSDEGQDGTSDVESVSVDGSCSFLHVHCCFHILLLSHYCYFYFVDYVVRDKVKKEEWIPSLLVAMATTAAAATLNMTMQPMVRLVQLQQHRFFL